MPNRNDLIPKNPTKIYKFAGTSMYEADITKEQQYIELEKEFNELQANFMTLLSEHEELKQEVFELRIIDREYQEILEKGILEYIALISKV